jgi:hypothetical protein
VGLVYRPDSVLDLDPDAEVKGAIRLVFETFERTGSAVKTVRFFREQGILFPRRLRSGSNKGELLWALPQHARILQVLHNPRYAGAFAYGRTRTRHRPDGSTTVATMPRSEWQFVMHGIHRGYIDWDRFEANQQQLADNARAYGIQRRSGPVREGPALLQGRVLCGLCGERMGVHYSQEHGRTVPVYICQENTVRRGGRVCQTVPGKIVDPAIGALLVELMTPMALDVTLAVQQELEARAAETDALRRQHVERMRYEAELARRRYMKVDPDNRLVADALEAEWNDKLRGYSEAVEDYQRRSRDQAPALDTQARRRILDLAERFPAVWQDPRVEPRERKRILRLLIEDVTLIKGETITAHVRLRGGATRTLVLDRPLPIAQIRKFKPELVAEVHRLLDQYCDREIAEILNQRASRTWEGKPFNLKKIAFIRQAYKLPSRYERLRLRGMLTTCEVAARFEVSKAAVHDWGRQGLIRKCYSDSLTRGLWEIPAGQTILKGCGGRGARPARLIPIAALQPERGAV